jgi:hypothetical protein
MERSMKTILIFVTLSLIASPAYSQTLVTLGTSTTAANPYISGDTSSGLYTPIGSSVAVVTGGVEKLRVNGTGVGIGTTSPAGLLDVEAGTAAASTNGTNITIVAQAAGSGNQNGGTIFLNPGAKTGSGANGGVAIGYNSVPSYLNANSLILAGSVYSGEGYQANSGSRFYWGTSSAYITGYGNSNTTDSLRFFTDSTEYLRITGIGDVGIGTTAPDNILSLGGQSAETIDMVRETTASTAGNDLTIQAGGAVPSGTNLDGGALTLASGVSTGTGSSNINFDIYEAGSSGTADNAPTTAMTIAGAGLVGIGTMSPGYVFDVNAGSAAFPVHIISSAQDDTIFFEDTGTGGRKYNVGSTGSSSGAGNGFSVYDITAQASRFLINPSGNVGVGTTSPVVSLDLSQKTDAVAIPVGASGNRPTGVNLENGEIRYNSTSSALEAYVNNSWVSFYPADAGSVINSSGQLLCGGSTPPCHSSTLSYCPYKGNLETTASYGTYTIPSGTAASGCLTANLASMYIGGTASQAAAANTLYYVYLINISGTTYLDLETTGHATDSGTGIEIESGNNTRTLIGMIHTDSSKEVATQGTTNVAGDTNTVATWDNRIPTTTQCAFTTNRSLVAPTTDTEINSENRCLFMSWGDGAQFSSDQDGYNTTAGDNCETFIKIDGATFISAAIIYTVSFTPQYLLLVAPVSYKPTDGFHYTTLYGNASSGSTCTWYGAADVYTFVFGIQ